MHAASRLKSQATCGYHLMSPCEVVLQDGYPLYRSLDAVPDPSRIDVGQFSIDVAQVDQWAKDHPLARPMCIEDQEAMQESIMRSRNVLLPVFVNHHGKLLAGSESIRAVAKIQKDEQILIENIPVACVHIENEAAEAELVMALNYGHGGGTTQSQLNTKRRAAVRALLLAGHDGTDRLIAGLCGLKDTTIVKQIRLNLEGKGLIERRVEFTDRRGCIQKRAEEYDSLETERQEVVAEVSGPDTTHPEERDHHEKKNLTAEGDHQPATRQSSEALGIDLFLTKWFQVYGSRPVWPEELEVIAAECVVEVPNESGAGSGFSWIQYPKPDGSDWVFVLRATE